MNLRPHHLLCIQKYTGYGYNVDFTTNMDAIVAALAENKETPITVTQGCDDLCKACPNQKSGACTWPKKVAFMDRTVQSACRLTYGEQILWADAVAITQEQIFDSEEFYNICACCEWFELCRSTEVRYE